MIKNWASISETANYLKVSTATVRNWIKANHLVYDKEYGIEYNSILNFKQNIAGVDKLNKRANKSELDDHNHQDLIEFIQKNITNKDIADIYQNKLANSYRNQEGVYYTPQNICQAMLSDIPKPIENQTFCDPCCGGGNFILTAMEYGFEPSNVYGFDIDPIAVQITIQRIFNQTGFNAENNIICLDYLKNRPNKKFDVVVTNPPWGKKLSKQEKEYYGKLLNAGKSIDTCSLFFLQILENTKNDGYVSLLLPDAFFTIATFQDVRNKLLAYNLIGLRDFNNVFKGTQAKAQSFCLQKTNYKNNKTKCFAKNNNHTREQNSFINNPKQIINLNTNDIEQKVIEQIHSKPYLTLKNNAKWGLGIVTGNNTKFIYKENKKNDLIEVYKGLDVYPNYLKETTNFLNIKNDLHLYQQVPPLELFQAPEKIIYRFISNKLICYCDTDQVYCLNSANFFIVATNFPVSMQNITHLFNSKLYNWLFNKLFNTHKVLRSDLENLPIPTAFFNENTIFSEQNLLTYFNLKEDNNGSYTIKN